MMRVTYVGPLGDGETIVAGDREWSAKPGETIDVPDDIAARLSTHWQPAEPAKTKKGE
jgi:hypothetical protein